jgi:hypothetical protein
MSYPLPPFSDMFTEDSRVADWLDTHCEYDHTDRCWYGKHYFGNSQLEYVAFHVKKAPNNLVHIFADSHWGIGPTVTGSVSELLRRLDNTDWRSIAIMNVEDWLNDKFDAISTDGSIVWNGVFNTSFTVQPNLSRKFEIERMEGRSEFIIHHGVEGVDPFSFTRIDEMQVIMERDLKDLCMKELYKANPALLELSKLLWWLDENFTLEEDQSVWHGTHPQAPEDIDFRIEEIPGGFLVECDFLMDTLDPFTATSIDALQEFMVNTKLDSLFYHQEMINCDTEERAFAYRLHSAGPAHPDHARYFD